MPQYVAPGWGECAEKKIFLIHAIIIKIKHTNIH